MKKSFTLTRTRLPNCTLKLSIKYLRYSLLSLTIGTFLISCQDWTDEKLVETLHKKYKYNIIGISGVASSEPYVEVQYCKDDGHGNNIIVSEMLTPPILLGDHEVNVLCDSIIEIMGHGNNKSKYKTTGEYRLVLKHQYTGNGAEYFRIVNHSADHPIEFFIAGSQNMKTKGNGCNNQEVIDVFPSVYYQRAPIYYLLFPEKKYHKNLQKYSDTCNDVFYFEGNRCGNLVLTHAWSVDNVMNLYRSEYKNSSDTKLYLDIRYENYGRLSKMMHSDYPFIKNKRFYGVIMPGEELRSDNDISLLATPSLVDDELCITK